MLGFIKRIFGLKPDLNKRKETRILVVDDSPSERAMYVKTLRRAGYATHEADGAVAALEMLTRIEPHLILSDYMMPQVTGKEFCRRLKENQETRHIPIVFLTGSANPKDILECLEAGAEKYLSKPISGRDLIHQVEEILDDVAAAATVLTDEV